MEHFPFNLTLTVAPGLSLRTARAFGAGSLMGASFSLLCRLVIDSEKLASCSPDSSCADTETQLHLLRKIE